MKLSIKAKDISVRINGREILRKISLEFSGPGLFFIIGENGSGKSTLLRVLAGLIPYEGDVIINDRPQRDYSRKELAKTVGYVWQNPLYGFFEESVEREIAFILKNLGLPLSRMDRIIEFFGLKDLLDRSPFTLSGGEAKRVSISSIIVADQPIILFDEPEAEMDLEGLNALMKYVREHAEEKLIIIATHNPLVAYKLRENVRGIYYLKDGEIVHTGGIESLSNAEFLVRIGVVPLSWWRE